MITALLVVHLFVTLALIGVVLIQRSEGGGLGVGTSQGMGGFMSGRGTANLLTRTTAILGTAFFVLSMALALLNRGTTVGNSRSILDVPTLPATRPVPPPTQPAAPAVPTSPALTPNPAANATPAPAGPPGTILAAPADTAPALPVAPPPAAQLPAPASDGSPPVAPRP